MANIKFLEWSLYIPGQSPNKGYTVIALEAQGIYKQYVILEQTDGSWYFQGERYTKLSDAISEANKDHELYVNKWIEE